MILIYLILIILASFALIHLNKELLVRLKQLDDSVKLGGFELTSIFLALATSLPELFVGITSALKGSPNIALGNILGANIANLSFVAGIAAFIGGGLTIKNGSTREDLLHAFVAGLAPLLFLLDRELSRLDGLILLTLYGFYNFALLTKRVRGYENEGGMLILRFLHRFTPRHTQRELGMIFIVIAGIFISADLIVRSAKLIAFGLGIQVFLVALFIVALGTTLPELTFELEAVRKHETSMFMGNVIGSIVANATLILGVTSLLSPIRIVAFSHYLRATVFFVLVFFLFYLLTATKKRLERWEGFVLVLSYSIFFLLELM